MNFGLLINITGLNDVVKTRRRQQDQQCAAESKNYAEKIVLRTLRICFSEQQFTDILYRNKKTF